MFSAEALVAIFLAVILVASLISVRAKVPYTLVLVILGIALSATSAISVFGIGGFNQLILQIRTLFDQLIAGQSGGLFVGLVVPPLLFEAMIHIRSTDLRAVIRPSFVLATVGVLISSFVAGFLLWKVAGLPFFLSFLFAAIISPTDVATVLEVFRNAKVPSRLSALMDTEAAFNDASGIVVFTIILAFASFGKVSLVSAASSFALVFAGGALVGLVVAFIAELLSTQITEKLTQTILTISAVYGSYALASSLGVSGLIAVTVVGLYFGNFTIRTTMGQTTRDSVILFWEFAAFVGNSIAFLFIGFSTDIFKLAAAIGPIIVAYIAITVARAASVYPILTIFNRFGQKIPLKWRNVAMLGGMRGALSIALAASVPLTVISANDQSSLTTLVLGVAFISISIQAALLFRYIKRKFASEQLVTAESLNAKLSKAASAIESLEKLREEGRISDEEFAVQLANDKEELGNVVKEINANVDPRSILRQRAYELYTSVLTNPVTRARQAFRKERETRSEKNNEENQDTS